MPCNSQAKMLSGNFPFFSYKWLQVNAILNLHTSAVHTVALERKAPEEEWAMNPVLVVLTPNRRRGVSSSD